MTVYDEMANYLLDNKDMLTLSWERGWNKGLLCFVCHKSHIGVVSEMLRGAKGQCRLIGSNQAWSDCNLGIKGEWSADFWYTSDRFESRIIATV